MSNFFSMKTSLHFYLFILYTKCCTTKRFFKDNTFWYCYIWRWKIGRFVIREGQEKKVVLQGSRKRILCFDLLILSFFNRSFRFILLTSIISFCVLLFFFLLFSSHFFNFLIASLKNCIETLNTKSKIFFKF